MPTFQCTQTKKEMEVLLCFNVSFNNNMTNFSKISFVFYQILPYVAVMFMIPY